MWDSFYAYAALSGILMIFGAWFGSSQRYKVYSILYAVGWVVLGIFIIQLWLSLERPPMRTLGETRLWYAFLLPAVGYFIYFRWRYNWILWYSLVLSGVFLLINVLNPDIHNKSLMPALQSPWFIPHVVVYMFSYALLGASALTSSFLLYQNYFKKDLPEPVMESADRLVVLGFGFLTFGLLFGALWAKEAWGHYWTWDPKETWAFLTWICYLLYIHYRFQYKHRILTASWILTLAFGVLIICWFGVQYLPSAQSSVHTYSN